MKILFILFLLFTIYVSNHAEVLSPAMDLLGKTGIALFEKMGDLIEH